MFSSISNRIQRLGAKRLVIATGFVVAMAAATGLGFATKQFAAADIPRDCDNNAILRCGAASPKEFISDVKSLNTNTQTKQADLQKIYADSRYANLPSGKYERFQNEAKMGTVYKDGRVVVDGYVVMTDAKSMGRQSFGKASRKPLTINGVTYYYSETKDSFASNSISAMVLFDGNGVVESVILTSCGNPVWGTKKVPSYSCKSLNHTRINETTHEFTTSVNKYNATVKDVTYNFGDGTKKTVANPAEKVRHTYAQNGNYRVTATVRFVLPNGKIVSAPLVNCVKEIKVDVPQPYYACDMLSKTALNKENTKYRFTVKARAGNGATLKDVDFTLDSKTTTTGVTTKDAQGNIYKDYEFARDGAKHTVVAKVNFNLAGKVTSVTCKAEQEAGKTPECKPGIPVGSPECEEKQECKPGVPMGSPECEDYKCPIEGKEDLPKEECVETPEELPHTGMGSVAGLFAGTSAFGAVAHRVISSRRNRQ